MGEIRFGPARVPSHDSPDEAIAILLDRGYTACEIDFEGGFWMDYDWAGRFGELARDAGIALSVHAPLPAFLGHVERGKKFNMALGMLDHTAGIAVAAGAEVVVFHPGFLLGRERDQALDDVVSQLGDLHARLEQKGRLVPFGVEVMGRVRELGTADDVFVISERTGWIRPVIDFAHMHATSDGAFTDVDAFAAVLERADELLPRARAVPHPLLGHRVCEPQRDEAPAVRRRHAARGAARRGPEPLRAAGDRDQRVARRGVAPGRQGGAARRSG